MTANLPAPIPIDTAPPTFWRSTTGLRTALTWLLAADAVAAFAMLTARLNRISVIDDFKAGSATIDDGLSADNFVRNSSRIYFVTVLATAAVLIVWQWRAANNNESLGRIRPRLTTGWSIGGWFVPFANAVIPVRCFQDLYQGSDPDADNHQDWRGLRRSSLIGWWWALYLTGNLLSLGRWSSATLDEAREADQWCVVAFALTAVAAVLAIFVVRMLTARQEAARDEQRTRQASVASSGWYADPTGRFDHRYWNGSAWTLHASRGGETVIDPIVDQDA